MTSRGSLLVHHLYFSPRQLHPVSERFCKDSQPCISVALGHNQHPRARCQPSHTCSSCAWSNKSVRFSLGFHSFSSHLFTVCLYTTISAQLYTVTFTLAQPRLPARAQDRDDPFVLISEKGEHVGTKRRRDSESREGGRSGGESYGLRIPGRTSTYSRAASFPAQQPPGVHHTPHLHSAPHPDKQ